MNGYIAFYRGRRMEIWAETSYAAQQEAARKFKAKKPHEVVVVMAERADGSPVIHTPDF